MSNLFNKANTFYFVASSLATLMLLTSLALTVTSNVPLSLILALAALSVLVFALSYKIISNNKKIKVERIKFAQKEQELENKITLGKEAEEAANKEVEKLKHELTQEKQNLDKRAKRLAQKVNESEVEREYLLKEKESLEKRLETAKNRTFEIDNELGKTKEEIDKLVAREEELHLKILRLREQLQEKEERITELKGKIDNNQRKELENKKLNEEVEKLSKEKEELNKEKNKLCKEKHTLSNKKEELNEKQDELQCKIEEIKKEKEKLSKELEEKREKLDRANNDFELEDIVGDFGNKERKLNNLLSKKDHEIERLEKNLQKERGEKEFYIVGIAECMICKLEGLIKKNEVIKNDDKAVILREISAMRLLLEEVTQYLPDEMPVSSPNDCINNQSFELDGIRKDCGNEVKKLQDLLLEKFSEIEQLQKGLREVMSFIQRAMQHITCEVEEPIRRNGDNNIEAVLKKVYGEAQAIKSLLKELEEKAAGCLSDENVSSFEKDLGYESLPVSRSSTPIKLPGLLWTERCKRSQFRNVGLVEWDN